jgi:hypothetical protein
LVPAFLDGDRMAQAIVERRGCGDFLVRVAAGKHAGATDDRQQAGGPWADAAPPFGRKMNGGHRLLLGAIVAVVSRG